MAFTLCRGDAVYDWSNPTAGKWKIYMYIVEAFLVKVTPTEEQHEVFDGNHGMPFPRVRHYPSRFDFPPHEIHIGLPRSVCYGACCGTCCSLPFLPLLVLFYHILDWVRNTWRRYTLRLLLLQVNDQPVKCARGAQGHACEQKEYRRHPREECPPRRVAAPHDGVPIHRVWQELNVRACVCVCVCVCGRMTP